MSLPIEYYAVLERFEMYEGIWKFWNLHSTTMEDGTGKTLLCEIDNDCLKSWNCAWVGSCQWKLVGFRRGQLRSDRMDLRQRLWRLVLSWSADRHEARLDIRERKVVLSERKGRWQRRHDACKLPDTGWLLCGEWWGSFDFSGFAFDRSEVWNKKGWLEILNSSAVVNSTGH